MMQSKWNVALVVLFLAVSGIAKGVTPFSLPWMNGEKGAIYSSANHPNSVTVVETFFLNCPYCNDNAPLVDDLADFYKNEPRVQVLDVGIDRFDSQYAEWIRRHNPNHPVLKDARRTLIGELGTQSYPSTYILDCRGKVQYSSLGVWTEGRIGSMKSVIDRLLSQSCGVSE